MNQQEQKAAERGEKERQQYHLLKTLEQILRNKIKKKQEQIYKTQIISENDKLSIEIDTLHWVLSQSLSIRRLLKGQQSELRYDITVTGRRRKE